MRNVTPLRGRRISATLAVFFLLLTACGKPPARMAYDSIDGATVAVQGALRAFNVLYQNGQATEADRTTAKAIYTTFQAVALGATYTAEMATTKEEAQAAVKRTSDAAVEAVTSLEKLSTSVKARAPGGQK
jgi:hypothetical protein